MSDYQNLPVRLVDLGINVRDANDTIQQWVKLDNVDPAQEGSISTRPGRSLLFDTAENANVHTIRRVGANTLLFGVGTKLYRNVALLSSGWSGVALRPVSLAPDLVSIVWTYVSDGVKARKVNEAGLDYKWGITAPVVAASFSASATAGNLDSSVAGATVYDWRFIYYSTASGAKSNPSPTANGVAVVGKKGSIALTASTDPQVDQIRVFRRGGANGGTTWRFSFSTPNITATLEDNNADSTIALNEALELDNDVPFTSVDSGGNTLLEVPLPYISDPFLGKYLLACGDVNRPGYVYWTNPGTPDQHSPGNNLQVTSPLEPLVGVFIYSTQPFVWSRDNLYFLDFGGPNAIPTFTSRLTPCGAGIVGPNAYAVSDLIYFVSPDGIYFTNGQNPAESITENSLRPLFHGLSVADFLPIDFSKADSIGLECAGETLHFTYKDTGGTLRKLEWHKIYRRWKSSSSQAMTVVSTYEDENQARRRIFFGAADGKIYEQDFAATQDGTSSILVNVRTGSHDFGSPQTLKEFGNIIVDCDPQGGTISLTPYLDAETRALSTQTITGSGRQKVPLSLGDAFGYSLATNWSWTGPGKIFQFDILYRVDEEAIKHWEFPPTTHGMSGWQQARDAYITLRSGANVTLTVEVDGVTYTYTVPSTGGFKLKQYVQLRPVRGKIFRYSLDSTSAFRIYGDECEIRVKPWNMGLGYKLVSPFSRSGLGLNGVADG